MQASLSAKTGVPTRATAAVKPARASRHVVMAINGAERQEPFGSAKAIAVAGLAALLIGTEAPAFAASTATPGQGAVLEQMLAEQKAGKVAAKTIKPKQKAEAATYNPKATKAAPKLAASSAPKKVVAPKKTAVAATKTAKTTLKFDSKAGAGTQGSAPAGLELPVPKGAKAAPAPKAAAAKKAEAPKPKPAAAAKPVAAAKKAEAPKPAPVVKNAAKTAAVAGAAATAVKAVSAPAVKAVAAPKSAAAAAPAFNEGLVQAGAVLAAEVVGVAVAGSIVGGITRPTAAAKKA